MDNRKQDQQMRITKEEREHPREWLEQLGAARERLVHLVVHSGGLAQAAYRVARAARRADKASSGEPSVRELKAAARVIASGIGCRAHLPISSALVARCEPVHVTRMPLPPSRRKAS